MDKSEINDTILAIALASIANSKETPLKLEKIMTELEKLNAKIDSLQAALDDEQVQINKVITDLENLVILLETGTSPAIANQLQPISQKIDAIITDLKSTIQ